MNWKQVKVASDIQVSGVSIELDRVGDSLKGIIISDSNGNKLRVRENSYSIAIEASCPPPTKKQYRVEGEIHGAKIQSVVFDNNRDAEIKASEWGEGCSVVEIEVPIE